MALHDASSDSTQHGCTLWLGISCIVLTLTTAFVFGWGLGAPNMYTQYTDLFLKGKSPCETAYDIGTQSKPDLAAINFINTGSMTDGAIDRLHNNNNNENISLYKLMLDETVQVHSEVNMRIDKNMTADKTENRFDFVGELIKGVPQTIFLIGAFIGALTSQFWLHMFHRKQTIFINYIFTFASSLCMLLSYYFNRPILFYLSRFLLGYQSKILELYFIESITM